MSTQDDGRIIAPGATIGVLGSGQLGRMLGLSARRMGYRVATFSPDHDTPMGQIADAEHVADYTDLDAVAAFAKSVDVVTFEFENVPFEAAEAAARHVPVRPRGQVLHIAQHRRREKDFLHAAGFPTAPFEHVPDRATLDAAIARLGVPCVLKTAGFGYDGKGQMVIKAADEAEAAWQAIGAGEAVLEGFVDFACEVSVVAARGLDGAFAHYGVTENRHADHILDVSIADGIADRATRDRAIEIAAGVLEALDVVGVLCVEFFVGRDGTLVVNELAPRPHNSGHFSFDACVTGQFEQQLRAVCGLPLGSTARLRASAMVNLLGDLWAHGEPDWASVLADPDLKLHLYGKAAPRPGRKMGHMTVFGRDGEDAASRAIAARQRLAWGG
ncbi:5-(carboxyamino)imidazole ribonucleotide synthase [uncultured Salinisphaera sp.]|uniref:5-(carboxyamino)imidazole ribonucleotide synthase n=1 Tax=uncultured Salinisphaera sp. TaxID=359372 RepID=UPI0032B1BD79|tara:strand:- start:1745 stop:2902 length:1158 start_codon:yes stop_codon:yes gene_type:complete